MLGRGKAKIERDSSAREMNQSDVCRLDHEDQMLHFDNDGMRTRGNDQQGKRLRHAKGVGLSIKLKQFLENSN